MKKIILLILVFASGALAANAQYKFVSGNVPENLEIIQVDQLEKTTRLFLCWTSTVGNFGFDVDDDIAVLLPGSFKRYEVKDTGNIPFTSDGSYAMAENAGDKIYFYIDFVKFALDVPFTVVENAENDSQIDLKDIVVEDAGLPMIDPDAFVKEHPSFIKGTFLEDNVTFSFWNHNGLGLMTYFVKTYDNTNLFYVHVHIVNNTGSDINFDPKDIVVEHENKNGKRIPLKLYTAKEYEKRMKVEMAFSNIVMVMGGVAAVESVAAIAGGDFYAAVPLADMATHSSTYHGIKNMKENVARLESVLKDTKQEYLEAAVIKNQEDLAGYVCMEEKKKGTYQISITINGKAYTFAVSQEK